jgi:hypothetical protein
MGHPRRRFVGKGGDDIDATVGATMIGGAGDDVSLAARARQRTPVVQKM